MPVFKELARSFGEKGKKIKEKARVFFRDMLLNPAELKRVQAAEQDAAAEEEDLMSTVSDVQGPDDDEDEDELEQLQLLEPESSGDRGPEEEDEEDEEGENVSVLEQGKKGPVHTVAEEIDEEIDEEAILGVHYLFETPEEKRERIFETHEQEREDELEGLRGNGVIAKAKNRLVNEKINLKKKEIESYIKTQEKLSDAEIELNARKIALKKQLIALKKAKKSSAELEEEIGLIDEEIKAGQEEFKFLETKTNRLREEIKAFQAELSEGNETPELEEKDAAEDESPEETDIEEDEDVHAHVRAVSKRRGMSELDLEEDMGESSEDYLTDKQREGLSRSKDGLERWLKAVKKIRRTVVDFDDFLESRRFQQLTTEELWGIIRLEDDDENLEWYIENLKFEVPEPIAKIIEQMNEDTKGSILRWAKDMWKPYTKDDLIKTLQRLDQRKSPLFKNSALLNKLTEKRLKIFIYYYKKGDLDTEHEGGADLLRDEKVQLIMKEREDKKDMWLSRGASPEETENHPIYEELTTLFPVGEEMKFFGEGEVNEDHLDEIEKVAKTLNTFKLFGSNPFKNFEAAIIDTVRFNGGGIKKSRQMYIDTRKKINQILPLAKKDPNVWKDKKNYELKKYYDAWLKASDKKLGDEINVQDIDSLLLNNKYEYLSKVESEVEILLNKIWETKFSAKETGRGKDKKFELQEKELDPKNQAIVRYFSEFLEQSNEVMKPLIEKKAETAYKLEYQAMEEENKYKENGEEEPKFRRKASRTPKSESASMSTKTIATAWHDLRLKGRMYVVILVQFCKSSKKTITESEKAKLIKLREKIIEQFLEELGNKFDTGGPLSFDVPKELKKFEAELKERREEIISATHMSPNDFDRKIQILEKRSSKKFKEEHYILPEI